MSSELITVIFPPGSLTKTLPFSSFSIDFNRAPRLFYDLNIGGWPSALSKKLLTCREKKKTQVYFRRALGLIMLWLEWWLKVRGLRSPRQVFLRGGIVARINIEEEWWSDPRRWRLAEFFGYPSDPSGQLKADGLMVRVWFFAMKYWKTKEYIPFHAWDGAGFPDEIFKVGLAEKHPTGVYVRGSSRHFEWYHRKTAGLTAGASAGGKSRIKTASRDEKGRLISAKSNIIQPEAQPMSRSSSPSSSSSSSSSSSKIQNTNTISSEVEKSTFRSHCHDRLRFSDFCERFLGSVKIKSQEVWLELYPDAEFLKREFLKIEEWITRNPAKSPKSSNGTARFVGGWLERGWESYRKTIPTMADKKESFEEYMKRKEMERNGVQ